VARRAEAQEEEEVSVPDWYSAALLALAAWRVFHLIAFDDILDRPRRYITRLNGTWRQEGDATGEHYRAGLAAFLTCPFCLGFWVTVVVWVLWLVFPTETLWVAVPFALNAGLIGAQRLLSSE
jgi:hypothetical protein